MLAGTDEDEERKVSSSLDTQLGTLGMAIRPAEFTAKAVVGDDRAFANNMIAVGIVTAGVVLAHYPTTRIALAKARDERRKARRGHALRTRRSHLVLSARQAAAGDAPVSRWSVFGYTWPRLELFIAILAYQGVAESSFTAAASPVAGTAARVLGACVFLLVGAVGVYGVAHFVRQKIQLEHRAVLVRDAGSGFLHWKDAAPLRGTKHTGFVEMWGVLFARRSFAEHLRLQRKRRVAQQRPGISLSLSAPLIT